MFEITDIVESKLQDKQNSGLVFEKDMLKTERAKELATNLATMFYKLIENYWAANLLIICEMGLESQIQQIKEIEGDIQGKVSKLKTEFDLQTSDEVANFFFAQSSGIQVALMTKHY